MIIKKILAHKKKFIILLLTALSIYFFCIPNKLFKDPLSTIILSNKGEMIGARIASDGQWRFPKTKINSYKFEQAIITFEDKYFYYHPGVNLISTFKALYYNIKAGKILSGGSTISMQVIRISRKGKKRNYIEKLFEMIMSTRLEI